MRWKIVLVLLLSLCSCTNYGNPYSFEREVEQAYSDWQAEQAAADWELEKSAYQDNQWTDSEFSYSEYVPSNSYATISSAIGIIKKSGTANAPIVNVYANPEFSINVIVKINNGVLVDVIGRSSNSKFVLISLDGQQGWISYYDIVSEKNLFLLPIVSYTGSTWD